MSETKSSFVTAQPAQHTRSQSCLCGRHVQDQRLPLPWKPFKPVVAPRVQQGAPRGYIMVLCEDIVVGQREKLSLASIDPS